MLFSFGDYVLDTQRYELRHGNELIALRPKALDLLICLVEHAGEVVPKQTLISLLWPGRDEVVTDAMLGALVMQVRQAVGDSGADQYTIQTKRNRGYCFITKVDLLPDKPDAGDVAGTKPIDPQPIPTRAVSAIGIPEPAHAKKPSTRRKLWITGGVLATVVLAGIGSWVISVGGVKSALSVASEAEMAFPLPEKPSIAVLPFDNLTGDTEQDYFVDGITEHIITALAKIPKLFVIARNSTFTYKGQSVSVKQVAEELGVRYVLAGSVQRSGERVRITAQLIDALTGRHLWADDYDRKLANIFALQNDITERIATELEVKLTEGDMVRVRRNATDNADAYMLFLQGREQLLQWNPYSNAKARQLYRAAFAVDPQFSTAWAGIGWTHLTEGLYGWADDRTEAFRQATEAAQTALAIDEFDADAYALLGTIYRFQGQHEKGIPLHEKALALSPNHGSNMVMLAAGYLQLALPGKCLALINRAMRQNPMYTDKALQIFANCNYQLGYYDTAIEALEQYRLRLPNDINGLADLAYIYAAAGFSDEAKATVDHMLQLDPDYSLKKYPFKRLKDATLRQQTRLHLIKAGIPE